MAFQTGDVVAAADFNGLLDTVNNVYGVGYGDRGYGQTAIGQMIVHTGDVITSAQWENLRSMIVACGNHQGTVLTNLVPSASLAQGQVVTAWSQSVPSNKPYDLPIYAAAIDTNRLTAAPVNMALTTGALADSVTTSWNVITGTYTVTFPSEDKARWFFNSGGQIRLRFQHPNGSTMIDNALRGCFANYGTFAISAYSFTAANGTGLTSKGFYGLTGTNQNLLQTQVAGVASTTFSIQACVLNVLGLNGGNGAAIQFTVNLNVTTTTQYAQVGANGTSVTFDIYESNDLPVPTPTLAINSAFNANNIHSAPVWETSAGLLANAAIGVPFNYQLQATDVSSLSLTYALSNATTLPTGLTLSSTGLISGTLANTAATSASFSASVTDGTLYAYRNFSIGIFTPPTWLTAAGSLGSGNGGTNVSIQLQGVDPNNLPLSYALAAGSLPPGLTLSNAGLISGTVQTVTASTPYPFTVNLSNGEVVVPRDFSYTVSNVATTVMQFSTTSDWTVPSGVSSVMFNWIVGGGGAGGTSSEVNYGGGGGGGGSGGFLRYQQVACTPGDVFHFDIGAGGTDDPSLSPNSDVSGGSTVVKQNGVVLFTVTGGLNGGDNTGNNQAAAGGTGGTPNGLQGVTGLVGTGDAASTPGSQGAPGPMINAIGGYGGDTTGGDQYTGGSAGKAGSGFGSGGGGAGGRDRTSPYRWAGGPGQSGVVELTYPSQGTTGGTPAANNSSWNPNSGTTTG